jgi:hypothetical protein
MYLHEDREIFKNTIEDAENSCGRVLAVIGRILADLIWIFKKD